MNDPLPLIHTVETAWDERYNACALRMETQQEIALVIAQTDACNYLLVPMNLEEAAATLKGKRLFMRDEDVLYTRARPRGDWLTLDDVVATLKAEALAPLRRPFEFLLNDAAVHAVLKARRQAFDRALKAAHGVSLLTRAVVAT